MTIFNYLTNNDLLFYGIFTSTAVFIGYSLCKSIWDNSESISDFDYLNTDLGTSSNVYSEVGTQTIPQSVSLNTTVLPVPDTTPQFLPNREIVSNFHELKYQEMLDLLGTEINERGVDELYLKHIVYSYTIEDLSSEGINKVIYSHLYELFY